MEVVPFSVTILSSVTSIDDYAFGFCISLRTVKYVGENNPGTESEGVFNVCTNLNVYM